MNREYSCGAVVFTRRGGDLLFVVVQEMSGMHSFPKGHMEKDETEIETARREVLEETGLQPVFLDGFRETDEYAPAEKPGTRKRVAYFLAECGDAAPFPQPGEIRKVLLLPYDRAMQAFAHEGPKRVLAAAHAFLTQSREA